MNISFFETEPWEKEIFEKEFSTHSLFFSKSPLSVHSIEKIQNTEILVVFIYSQVSAETLDLLPHLTGIATMSTGFDHIDITVAKQRGITVVNVPTYGAYTVAEHTFALLLSLSRNIVTSYKKIREWSFTPQGLTGFDLHGKTIGVIGVGTIGQQVAHIANGFGMNVLGFRRSPDSSHAQEFGYTNVSLEQLLKESDVVSLHLPYSDETHHFINRDTIAQMKQGAILLNTARGGLVDTSALLHALNSGKLAGAGLDVLEGEPMLREEKELLSSDHSKKELLVILENHTLFNHPNVVITPHNAFNSIEALHMIVNTTVENIRSFIKGSPQNTVD